MYSIGSSRQLYYVEGELENEVDSGIEELFQDETNIGTKEEFTSEVKSEVEPVSSDKSLSQTMCKLWIKNFRS